MTVAHEALVAVTGLQIDIHSESFLRDETDEVLAQYSAIYMLDLPRLDEPSIGKLERFARSGGGVCFFVGDNADKNFYNEKLLIENIKHLIDNIEL
jgi:hypothetical protein